MVYRIINDSNNDHFHLDASELQTMIKSMIIGKRRVYLGIKLLCWLSRSTNFDAVEYATQIMSMKLPKNTIARIQKESLHYGD